MKKVLSYMYEFFAAMGQARAAASLARAGEYELAKKIYLQ